jgi:hypothetical protein
MVPDVTEAKGLSQDATPCDLRQGYLIEAPGSNFRGCMRNAMYASNRGEGVLLGRLRMGG